MRLLVVLAAEAALLRALGTGLVVGACFLAFAATVVWWGHRRSWAASTAPQRVPFAGGLEPDTHAWSRFHVRYHPMTLVFVPFEMEMMFMYPWAVVYVEEGIKALVEMGMFLFILSVGILYAYREGAFRWQ